MTLMARPPLSSYWLSSLYKSATFFKRISPLHQYNHKFALEPCAQGILDFCHNVDSLFSSLLLNLIGMGEDY